MGLGWDFGIVPFLIRFVKYTAMVEYYITNRMGLFLLDDQLPHCMRYRYASVSMYSFKWCIDAIDFIGIEHRIYGKVTINNLILRRPRDKKRYY